MALGVQGRGDRIAAINVTPMADIMIVLLIIFMVATPLINAGRVRALPFAETATARKDSPLTVSVGADGVPYLNEIPAPGPEDLKDQLRNAFATARADTVVYVKAEGALPYGTVARVVEQCRDAGARQIALIASSRPAPSSGGSSPEATTSRKP